jgi:hypothetical protein
VKAQEVWWPSARANRCCDVPSRKKYGSRPMNRTYGRAIRRNVVHHLGYAPRASEKAVIG